MGTWRHRPFDSAKVLSFIAELRQTRDLALVRMALDILLDDAEYLAWPEAARVLVAGEVIAALLGEPASEIPVELADCRQLGNHRCGRRGSPAGLQSSQASPP